MFDRRIVLWVICALSFGCYPVSVQGQTKQKEPTESKRQLLAGAATANITPPLGTLVVGGWEPYPADDVHDELHARAIVLDDGTTKLAIVLCDNVGIPREVFDAAKQLVMEKTGIPVHCQMMAATHTHSAGSARSDNSMVYASTLNDYQAFLALRISDAVRVALKRLEPAQLAYGAVDEPSCVFNRRWYVVEDKERRNPFGGVDQVRMNPGGNATLIRPAGPIDPQVSFIYLKTLQDRPIALLANYSLHYVGGVAGRALSADYFGVFANEIAKRLNVTEQDPPFVGIMSNGTSGDVNNINFKDRGPGLPPYVKMKQVASLIADRVAATLPQCTFEKDIQLRGVQEDLELAIRKPDEKMLAYFAQIRQRPEGEPKYQAHELTYADRVDQLAAAPGSVKVPLQSFRLGSLTISAIPFEVFAEIGLELKETLPAPSFTIELANGSYGYLPTPSQHDLGGYETWMGTNKVEREASVKIVEALKRMAK